MENKTRLIDADALLEFALFRYGKTLVPSDIKNFPTVDAVEVVHGWWITEKCDHVPWRIKNPEKWVIYKCSVCGYSNGRKHSNYCPNCGAKMDGDGDG